MRWDPGQYAKYSSERSRPFFDLITQIGAADAETAQVVDLGCGSGELTATLADRWSRAEIRGIDSSPEMIAKAPRRARVTFEVGGAEQFDASGTDVLVSNAMLHWVSRHDELLTAWARQLNPGGWIAFQVPANFSSPSHVLMRRLAESPTWRNRIGRVLHGDESVLVPDAYLDLLVGLGLRVNVWQTEYLHVLAGEDPVLEWVRGTGLRPVLAALGDDEAAAFTAEFAALLRRAYPKRRYGTVFPFRRTFAVAHKA